jgi:hypothetical protein
LNGQNHQKLEVACQLILVDEVPIKLKKNVNCRWKGDSGNKCYDGLGKEEHFEHVKELWKGIGRFGNTQMTVNNQIFIGTLMNLEINPTRMSIDKIERI